MNAPALDALRVGLGIAAPQLNVAVDLGEAVVARALDGVRAGKLAEAEAAGERAAAAVTSGQAAIGVINAEG